MKELQIHSSSKDYRVLIEDGILERVATYLDPKRIYVILSDDGVPQEYLDQVTKALPKHTVIRFPQGESSKSLDTYRFVTDQMIEAQIPKDGCLIALGGGVTGDLGGFVAATYQRGIDLVQIPTTLLSQIDSSVGGKVAINTDKAKNVLGAFYPASLVLIDPKTLQTLSKRHFANGMAEMIKYGMIADRHFFDRLKNEDITKDLASFIFRSLEIKKHYVEHDEFDTGLRQSLNFGHTFGHALESYYHYEKYLHGEAVAIGMVMILSKANVRKELVEVLKKYHLPTEDSATLSELKDYIRRDKKKRGELLHIVDVLEIGESVITQSKFDL